MRLEGWEQRLWAVIEAARTQPYALGEHDCLRVALRTVEALTGVDRWSEFAGYKTKREALATIARFGSNFEDAISWFFGAPSVDVKLAGRGDICLVETVDGEQHLGVCLGRDTALLAPEGLTYLATLLCRCAWRVG
jgi:hypothetical protein